MATIRATVTATTGGRRDPRTRSGRHPNAPIGSGWPRCGSFQLAGSPVQRPRSAHLPSRLLTAAASDDPFEHAVGGCSLIAAPTTLSEWFRGFLVTLERVAPDTFFAATLEGLISTTLTSSGNGLKEVRWHE